MEVVPDCLQRIATNQFSTGSHPTPRQRSPSKWTGAQNNSSASNKRVLPRAQPNFPTEGHVPTRRPTVLTKTGDRTSTKSKKKCWRTLSQKFSRMRYFRPLRCQPSRRPCRSPLTKAQVSDQVTEAQVRFSEDLRTPSPRNLNTATPLGLHRPLDKSLGNKILHARTIERRIAPTRTQAENLAAKPWSALTSTNPPHNFRRCGSGSHAQFNCPGSKPSGSSNRPANPSDRSKK